LTRRGAARTYEAFAYLKDILRKLAAGWPTDQIDELLPENWSAPMSSAEPEA